MVPTAPRPTGAGSRWARRLVFTLVILAVAVAIPTLVARLYVIPSGSMETTLHGCPGCENDRVLVDRLVYRFADPEPGEVVVFTAGPPVWSAVDLPAPQPGNAVERGLRALGAQVGIGAPDGTDFVKRVIAVGGQTVWCCDPGNRVIVNGVGVDEPYLYYDPEAGPAVQPPFPPVRVPIGSVFVMGDNRNASLDSRAPGNGPVPLAALAGKARFVVTPVDRLGRIDDTNPQPAPPN